jgi:hypothetical protein
MLVGGSPRPSKQQALSALLVSVGYNLISAHSSLLTKVQLFSTCVARLTFILINSRLHTPNKNTSYASLADALYYYKTEGWEINVFP